MRISCHLLHEIVEDISWKTSARSARIWVIVFREQNLHELLDRPATSTLGTPASFRRGQTSRDVAGGNWRRSMAEFAFRHRCEGDYSGNYFLIMDILASNF